MKTKTIQRIQKVTSKGQVTLPGAWRSSVDTDHDLVKVAGDTVTFSPVYPQDMRAGGYTTVFDAIRDNKGRGLRASDLLKMLDRIEKRG